MDVGGEREERQDDSKGFGFDIERVEGSSVE